MRIIIACLLLALLWISAGYSWGSGWAGIIADLVIRQPLFVMVPFLIILCTAPRLRLFHRAAGAIFFLTLYLCASYLFGLGLVIRFHLLIPSKLVSVNQTERWEYVFRRMDGTFIHQETGTGHNSPYVECSSAPNFSPTIQGSHQYRIPPFTLAWHL